MKWIKSKEVNIAHYRTANLSKPLPAFDLHRLSIPNHKYTAAALSYNVTTSPIDQQ